MTTFDTDKWNAEKYDAGSFIQHSCSNKLLSDYCFKDSSQILDVGCGDGSVTVQIAENFPTCHVLGIDRSADMIQYAKEKHAAISNLQFAVQDALEIDQIDQFDYAISFFCLQWIENQEEVIRRVNRALKVDGKILFVLPSAGNDSFTQAVEEVFEYPKWQLFVKDYEWPVYCFEEDEYRPFLEKAGFAIESGGEMNSEVELPDITIFRKFVEPLPIFQHSFPKEVIPDLIDDVTKAFTSLCQRNHAGKLIFDLHLLVFKANKI